MDDNISGHVIKSARQRVLRVDTLPGSAREFELEMPKHSDVVVL
ncbi:hypothetical protein [Rhizobium sp. MHM7A]|nr:hypothetical protein [Rhizobium sp. MHM7A]